MRPELINRFDGIVTFRALTRREVGKIFDTLIADLQDRLVKQGIGLSVSAPAKRYIIDKGFDDKHGARPLRRAIEDHIEHAIAEEILAGHVDKGDIVHVTVENKQITVSVAHETSAK